MAFTLKWDVLERQCICDGWWTVSKTSLIVRYVLSEIRIVMNITKKHTRSQGKM